MPLRVLKFWGVTRPKMSCFEPWILDAPGDGRGLQVVLPSNVLSHFVSLCQLPSAAILPASCGSPLVARHSGAGSSCSRLGPQKASDEFRHLAT